MIYLGDIRDQLQTLTGAALQASQLSAAGGKAFVSSNAKGTQADLNEVVAFWQSIHAPTYGMPIPGSGKSATGTDADPTIYSPESNEVAYVNGLSVNNTSGSDAAVVNITIGNAQAFTTTVPAGQTAIVLGMGGLTPFYLVNGQSIGIVATGATPGDVAWTLAYGLSVQG